MSRGAQQAQTPAQAWNAARLGSGIRKLSSPYMPSCSLLAPLKALYCRTYSHHAGRCHLQRRQGALRIYARSKQPFKPGQHRRPDTRIQDKAEQEGSHSAC